MRHLGLAVAALACVLFGIGLGLVMVYTTVGIVFMVLGVSMMLTVAKGSSGKVVSAFAPIRMSAMPMRDRLWLRSAAIAIIAGGIGFGEMLHSEDAPAWSYIAASASASWIAVFFLRELALLNRQQDERRARLRDLRRRYGSKL